MGGQPYEAYVNFADSLIPDYAVPFHLLDAAGGYLSYQQSKHIQNAMNQSPASPWLNVLSVRYILSFFDVPGFKKIWTGPSGIQVFNNRNALPRAYFISRAVFRSPDDSFREITNGTLNPRMNVVLNETPDTDLTVAGNFPLTPLTPQDISPNHVSIRIESLEPGWVVFTDTYDPGWRVWANGKPARLYRANCVQRSVHINAGQTILDWRYQPVTWNFGALISLSTLITMFLLIRASKRRKFISLATDKSSI